MRFVPTTYEGCICVTGSGACVDRCMACRLAGHLYTCPKSAPDRWINGIDPVTAGEAARAKVRLASKALVSDLLNQVWHGELMGVQG